MSLEIPVLKCVVFVEKERKMSTDDLIEAVRGNDGKEVLRLTDEEHIDVNRRNQVIIFLSFLDYLGLVE